MRLVLSNPAIALRILILISTTASAKVYADEYDRFAIAKNAFDAGEYKEAVNRFEILLSEGLQNFNLTVETLKLVGVSYLFIGNKDAAEEHFTKLLNMVTDFSLDPLLYPIEVVDFFTEIKQKNQKRLDELAKAKAIEESERKEKEEAQRKAEYERMKRNIYLERKIIKRSLLTAVVPFGVGQFQNEHRIKGWIFFSSQIVLSTSAIVFYFLHSGLRSKAAEPFEDPSEKNVYINREKAFRLANHISIVSLGVAVVAGVVDSLYYFRKETIEWKKLDEKEVPPSLKPFASKNKIVPDITVSNDFVGVGLIGEF